MAERVEIMVVANDAASQVLRGLTSNFGALGNMVQSLTSGGAITGLTEQLVSFGKEALETTVNYVQEVKNLSLVSGESMENTGRFIQVLDDYGLTTQDALTATKALTKEGMVPNIETLATLSDKYRSLQTVQEKNEFILKNLGKSGLQWAKMLELGSDRIKELGENVDEALLPTEELYEQTERLRLAQDDWSDTMQIVQLTLGTKMLPTVTELTTKTLEASRATSEEVHWLERLIPAIGAAHTAYIAVRTALGDNTTSTEEAINAQEQLRIEHEKTKEELKAEEDAIKALTKANEDYLGLVGDLTSSIQNYEEKEASLQKEHAELLAQKQTLINQGYWPESEAVQEVNQKLAENEAALQKNAEEHEKATYRIILSMAQQRLSINGLDSAESAFLLQQGVEWGIYSQKAVDKANDVMAKVDDMINSYNNIPSHVETDIVTNHIDNYFNSYENAGQIGGYAGGGNVRAGQLVRVNETRTEYFRPSMSGTIIPLGPGGGAGGNGGGITVVYSPMISTADRSEVQNKLLPAIIEGVRKAKADKII